MRACAMGARPCDGGRLKMLGDGYLREGGCRGRSCSSWGVWTEPRGAPLCWIVNPLALIYLTTGGLAQESSGPQRKTRRAAARTEATSMPSFSASTLAGAEAPKRSMPTQAPSSPT